MSKILERLVDYFVGSGLEPSFLSHSHHACSRGKSTETALHTILSCIQDSISIKQYTLETFIDIKGAFNKITASSILNSGGARR